MTEREIRDTLRQVVDPEVGINIVDLGLVYRIDVGTHLVHIVMTMTSPACPLGEYLRDLVGQTITSHVPEAPAVTVDLVWDPPWTVEMMSHTAKRQLGSSDEATDRAVTVDTGRLARTAARLPLLALALLSMAWAIWLGLLRLGWALPLPRPDQLILHGPLIIGGFLGTLIGLERAIALGRRWAYAAPVLTASGAVLLVLGPPGPAGAALIMIGSSLVVVMFLIVCQRQPSLFALTMLLGAAAWAMGNARWLAGAAIFRVVFWWVAFLVLTIAGERLELNRLLRPTREVRVSFLAAIVALTTSVLLTIAWPAVGVRTMGVALAALAWWLIRHDIARRTIHETGLTRFMAVCLLSGYAWLGFGGLVAAATGPAMPGPMYDLVLHAVFLGFALSMVFGHAPVIFPTVLGVPVPYRSAFYLHLGLLHGSLALRVVGDLVDTFGRWRVWGGLVNACALLLFVANTLWSVIAGVRATRSARTASRAPVTSIHAEERRQAL